MFLFAIATWFLNVLMIKVRGIGALWMLFSNDQFMQEFFSKHRFLATLQTSCYVESFALTVLFVMNIAVRLSSQRRCRSYDVHSNERHTTWCLGT